MVMFYNCSLRAHLMVVKREPDLNTVQDIIDRVDKAYIPTMAARMLSVKSSKGESPLNGNTFGQRWALGCMMYYSCCEF